MVEIKTEEKSRENPMQRKSSENPTGGNPFPA